MRDRLATLACLAGLVALPVPLAAQTGQELQELNWAEFAGLVRARIQNVLLPTGTL